MSRTTKSQVEMGGGKASDVAAFLPASLCRWSAVKSDCRGHIISRCLQVAPIPRLEELLAWFAANMPTDRECHLEYTNECAIQTEICTD
jgi:hypothetical protein